MSNDVSEYLNGLPIEEGITLGGIRKQVLNLVPDVKERLSRGVHSFTIKEKEHLVLDPQKRICHSLSWREMY